MNRSTRSTFADASNPNECGESIGRRRRVPTIGARFHDLPFVGRSTQWELLASIMAMVANGRSAIVAVTGEAGAGKTRLVAEALDSFPEPCRDRVHRCMRPVRRNQRVGTDRHRFVPPTRTRSGRTTSAPA